MNSQSVFGWLLLCMDRKRLMISFSKSARYCTIRACAFNQINVYKHFAVEILHSYILATWRFGNPHFNLTLRSGDARFKSRFTGDAG